ncbi:MAG: hypothetical protein ACD_46C00373G0001 [uncultured bacterium]|nr:MAG: hypothetical protein ACD_46C00373G0001 [uncultured bacterium]
MTISLQGWNKYSIWDHSATVYDLYKKRCLKAVEEMTAHKQAALLLRPLVHSKDTLLDVGCGGGYFFHVLQNYNIPVTYYGLDASETIIEIGKKCMPQYNLPSDRLLHGRIEDLDGKVDHIVCINVLSNIDNYHRPLERMLKMAKKSLILRESIAKTSSYLYVKDEFLDDGADLNVYVNTYDEKEITKFIDSYGFKSQFITDEYTDGKSQKVIGYEHHWRFVVAEKIQEGA